MKKYRISDKMVEIDIRKRPFNRGSEGKLYLIGDKLYKIYFPNAICEGFVNKQNFHQNLVEINDLFDNFVLPNDLIFDNINYVGYVTNLVGEEKGKKDGFSEFEWDDFIENIENLEKESDLLAKHRFLTVDIGIHNSIISKEKKKLYMIDPGRFCRQTYFTISDYTRRNRIIINEYFLRMMEREIINYKLIRSNKAKLLISKIKYEVEDNNYSDYFKEISKDYNSVHEFFKVKSMSM